MSKQEIVKAPSQEMTSVDGFIDKALVANVPVETMERLFSLREKVKAEQAREAFVGAMSRFQSECPVIEKKKDVLNKDNTVRYSYAPLDSIVNQVKAILGKNELSYTINVLEDTDKIIVTCKITHVLGHSETSTFPAHVDAAAFMNTPQKYASAVTFAKRYAFCNALGILTGEPDVDANDIKDQKFALDVKKSREKLEACKSVAEAEKVWATLSGEMKHELKDLPNELRKKFDKEKATTAKPEEKTTPEAKPEATVAPVEKPKPVQKTLSNPHLDAARKKMNGEATV